MTVEYSKIFLSDSNTNSK